MQLKKWVIKNKYKLIAGSAFFAGLVTIPTVVGTIQANQLKKNSDDRYIYNPGEIRFDENGKIIIPEVIDNDNPSGNYEYKLNYDVNHVVYDEFVNSSSINEKIAYFNEKNLNNLKTIINDVLHEKFKIDEKIKLAIDNIIPGNNFNIHQELNFGDYVDLIAKNINMNCKNKILSTKDIKNYCALSGINLDKEYNLIIKNGDVNMCGGGGAQIHDNNPPDSPQHVNVDAKTMTWSQQEDILEQNEYYLYIFAITNTAVLLTLTILSITFSILSALTGGASLSSLALLIPEIIFCSLTITSSWEEYYETQNLKHIIFTTLFNEVIYVSGIATSLAQISYDVIIETLDLLNIKGFDYILRPLLKKVDLLSSKVKWISATRLSRICNINSIASITYSIIMKCLYETLIKDIWITNYLNK